MLTTVLVLCLGCGCSFDDAFFPIDTRPADGANTNQEEIVLMSADGVSINHFLIKPQFRPKATIFAFHGSGSTVANWTQLLRPLLEDGYQLFLMEYRGFGNSEGHASHETVLADAHRAFLYLMGRDDVTNTPLLVLGQSYGGQLAINMAASYPDVVDALVTEGAFTSFRSIAVHSTPWIGKPFTWALFLNPYSSLRLIQEATVPKLIVHSRDDDAVPFFMGEELFDQAGGHKEFWAIYGAHTDAFVDYPEEFVVRINGLVGLAGSP